MWAGTGTCKHSSAPGTRDGTCLIPVFHSSWCGRRAASEEPVAPRTSNPPRLACAAPAPAPWGRALPLLGRELLGEEPGHSSCEEAQLGLVSSRPWLRGEHARMWMRPGSGLRSSPRRHREQGWAPVPKRAGGGKGSFNINYSRVRNGENLSLFPWGLVNPEGLQLLVPWTLVVLG